jgi:hypothetical protein
VIVARENVALLDSWGATDTVLISRKPFSPADLDRARRLLLAKRALSLFTFRATARITHLPGCFVHPIVMLFIEATTTMCPP